MKTSSRDEFFAWLLETKIAASVAGDVATLCASTDPVYQPELLLRISVQEFDLALPQLESGAVETWGKRRTMGKKKLYAFRLLSVHLEERRATGRFAEAKGAELVRRELLPWFD